MTRARPASIVRVIRRRRGKLWRRSSSRAISRNTPQGKTRGRVKRKLTSTTQVGGIPASEEDPRYLVESEESGKEAAHKPDSLRTYSVDVRSTTPSRHMRKVVGYVRRHPGQRPKGSVEGR